MLRLVIRERILLNTVLCTVFLRDVQVILLTQLLGLLKTIMFLQDVQVILLTRLL